MGSSKLRLLSMVLLACLFAVEKAAAQEPPDRSARLLELAENRQPATANLHDFDRRDATPVPRS